MVSLRLVAWLARTALTDEEKLCIKALALDIADLRKQINQLAEALAKMNDKQFKEAFAAEDKVDVTEKQVDNYQLALQKKMDAAESDLR
jgi:molybdopterin converting factor small subunit